MPPILGSPETQKRAGPVDWIEGLPARLRSPSRGAPEASLASTPRAARVNPVLKYRDMAHIAPLRPGSRAPVVACARALMSFSFVWPVGPLAPSGYGSLFRVQTNSGFVSGYTVKATLTVNGYPDQILAIARAPVSGGSQLCDLQWGWDGASNAPAQPPLKGPWASMLQGSITGCDVILEEFDNPFGLTIDGPTTYTNPFSLDPSSQGPYLVLGRLFRQADDNRDLIIAALSPPASLAFRTPAVGFSGVGSLARAGAYALRSQLTAVPSGWGVTFETPRRLIPAVGSIRGQRTALGADSVLLHYDEQLVILPSWSNVIRYSLKPGIASTFTLVDAA